ncbi:MAG TPA: chorismate-binding protein, partial [Saprospiraceae bacterium]|nr:chorismate-binding protein [Saprospiraceae bacterium]
MQTHTTRLAYGDPLLFYRHIQGQGPSCLFESASAVDKSSRMSLIGLEPSLEFVGKHDDLLVRLLHPRGQVFYDFIQSEFAGFVQSEREGRLLLHLPKTPFEGPEDERLERSNIAQPLRRLLKAFHSEEKNFMGLYGALAYQFVYLFEDLPNAKTCPEPDFHLFLYDTILLFNHLTQDLTLYVTRAEDREAASATEHYLHLFREEQTRPDPAGTLRIGAFTATPDDDTFRRQVSRGIQLCHEGELLEIVLSRRLQAAYSGPLLPLYERYKAINPSPYLFFVDLGDETLLGASPEMMLRYENGRATLRPISGSIRRSDNPIEDHHLMMQLLNDPKENSELDML